MWFREDEAKRSARRVARARKLMATKDYNDARLDLEGVAGEEAEALRREALAHLVRINLEAAAQLGFAGEREEAGNAVARARAFGATEEQLRALRRGPRGGKGGASPPT